MDKSLEDTIWALLYSILVFVVLSFILVISLNLDFVGLILALVIATYTFIRAKSKMKDWIRVGFAKWIIPDGYLEKGKPYYANDPETVAILRSKGIQVNPGEIFQGNSCPNCGSPHSTEERFCSECGHNFNNNVRCVKCGAEVHMNKKFCPGCGSKFE